MKGGFVKSSPRFFSMILRSMVLLILLLLALAALSPAPLDQAANQALTPNPVKSAWFLLWIQELVSWSRLMIWPVLALVALAFLLPWLPGQKRNHHACWFPVGQRLIAGCFLLFSLAILILTVVAMFMRGPNWSLVF